MDNLNPFDKAKMQCSVFSYGLISNISMLNAKQRLESECEDENLKESYEMLIELHCRPLQNGVIH